MTFISRPPTDPRDVQSAERAAEEGQRSESGGEKLAADVSSASPCGEGDHTGHIYQNKVGPV